MKNLFSLCLLLIIVFCSCSKEDPAVEILGIFELESYEIKSDCGDPEIIAQVMQATEGGCVTFDGDNFCRKGEFKSDGTVILTESYDDGEVYSETLMYTIDDNGNGSILFESANDDDFTFSLNGDLVTINGQEDGCTTIELYRKM